MKLIDLTGHVYSRLTVMSRDVGASGPHVRWICICACGTETTVLGLHLKRGMTKSCGCFRADATRTHNRSRDAGYQSWVGMMNRCHNSKDKQFKNYGGRGIAVCERWQQSVHNFLTDMGPRPGKGFSVDRIDVSGNYEPGNCRWATALTQGNNRRNNRRLTLDGRTQTLSEWSRAQSLPQTALHNRLARGWVERDALTIPAKPYRKRRQSAKPEITPCLSWR